MCTNIFKLFQEGMVPFPPYSSKKNKYEDLICFSLKFDSVE